MLEDLAREAGLDPGPAGEVDVPYATRDYSTLERALVAGAVKGFKTPIPPGKRAIPKVKPRKREPSDRKRAHLMWINHFEFLPGDESVKTSFDAVTSGVGGGLTGLVITSTTTGEVAASGGNKVVHMAVEVPTRIHRPRRVGYELTSSSSFISQIRLAQVQDPPATAIVLLDDGTDQTDVGPKDVDSASTSIDAPAGPLLLSLRTNFGSTASGVSES